MKEHMRKLSFLAVIVGWIFCSLIAYGTMLADLQGRFPVIAAHDCREDVATAAGLSLLFGPVAAVMSPFMTGFWERGFQLTCPGVPNV